MNRWFCFVGKWVGGVIYPATTSVQIWGHMSLCHNSQKLSLNSGQCLNITLRTSRGVTTSWIVKRGSKMISNSVDSGLCPVGYPSFEFCYLGDAKLSRRVLNQSHTAIGSCNACRFRMGLIRSPWSHGRGFAVSNTIAEARWLTALWRLYRCYGRRLYYDPLALMPASSDGVFFSYLG